GNEEWQDWLVDEESNHEVKIMNHNENQYKNALLENAMKSLNEREYLIIKERRLKEPPETLEALSEILGISRERVRQLEIRAFEKIQKAVKSAALQERIFE
ncbi:MAG: RNA polymerase factor sigma-32, partial [Alphaproteobacteria bacterium]|nr:RNA polymerase factor sigma-32 [Alphaproteobacteria bacterium]